MGGIYQVKARHICEGRLTPERREVALKELAQKRFVYYVDGWLWVRTRVKYLRTRGEKIAISILRDFERLPDDHRIRNGFVQEYQSGSWLSGALKQALSEDPSKTHPRPIDGSQGTGKGKGSKKDKEARDADWSDWIEHFRDTTGRKHTTGSAEARRFFSARRSEGKTVEELKLATIGCHSNERLRSEGFDRPETILRDSKHQRYIELGRAVNAMGAERVDRSKYDRGTREVAV
jgi:hypothetical protein